MITVTVRVPEENKDFTLSHTLIDHKTGLITTYFEPHNHVTKNIKDYEDEKRRDIVIEAVSVIAKDAFELIGAEIAHVDVVKDVQDIVAKSMAEEIVK